VQHKNVVANSHPGSYRADIDGLRAVAVLSVIGFHAFPNLLPGGFIGVDIFFVISGYLISGIIFKEVDKGRFSFVDFYSRRIRRIFPALALVLGIGLLFGSMVLFPKAAAELGLHTAAGALFVSNLLLWTESGYFDGEAALKPLLHLWSLGIEEQYYMLWPIAIAFCHRWTRLRLGMLITLALASFALNLALLGPHPVSAFYLPFTRFWELLVGAGLAYATLYGRGMRSAVDARLRQAMAWAGALLLAIGLVSLRPDQPFPGWRALLPTVGAALLIAGGPAAWPNRHVLSLRLATFVGAISYPLYLWHWPLLVFPRLLGDHTSRSERIAAVLASMLLAWLTYRFVESPIRSRPLRLRSTLVLAAVVGVIGLAGLGVYFSQGFPQRYPLALRNVALADVTFDYAAYRERTCFLQPSQGPDDFAADCVQTESGTRRKLIVLWGDSHAASLYPGLRSLIADDASTYRLAQFTASACPPVVGFKMVSRPHCEANNEHVLRFVERERPDTVVMLASWSFYTGDAFEKLALPDVARTVEQLRKLGVRKVVVLGPLPRWLEHQPNIVLREWQRTHTIVERSRLGFDDRVLAFDRDMAVALADSPSTFLSPIQTLCNADGCPLIAHRGTQVFPMAWDDAHLTLEGADTVAKALRPLILP